MMDVQNSYQHPSFSELLEIFPEGPAIIAEINAERIENWRREDELWEAHYYETQAEKNIAYVRKKLKSTIASKKEFEEFFKDILTNYIRTINRREDLDESIREIFIHVTNKRIETDWIKPLADEVKRLERIIRKHEWLNKPTPAGSINDIDIARAKEYPISSLVTPNHSGFIRCPFHDEKSGSCKIHKDNRYHCYGCGADGDVIDLAMKLFGLDFINAVKKILNK